MLSPAAVIQTEKVYARKGWIRKRIHFFKTTNDLALSLWESFEIRDTFIGLYIYIYCIYVIIYNNI